MITGRRAKISETAKAEKSEVPTWLGNFEGS
jgi:hypothetical protein